MENTELCHWGIKGMKWGVRRYQNKDGSLTPAGQKRYNKEMEKLKQEKKTLTNQARVKKKMVKMASLKKDVDDLKKNEKESEQPESKEETRKRLLSSTDAKDIYKNRDLLTTAELNDRINRIDTEARLKSKIVEEHKKTGMEYLNEKMQSGTNTINRATNLYKSVDDAYSTVMRSSIGKTLSKKLGLDVPKEEFNVKDVWEKRNKLSDEDLRKAAQRVQSEANLKRNMDTLDGKTGGNGKGLSESDVENIIERYLNERVDDK